MRRPIFILVLSIFLLGLSHNVYALTGAQLQRLYGDSEYYTGNNSLSGLCGSAINSTNSATQGTLSSGQSVYILGDSITERAASSYVSAFQKLQITAIVDGQYGRSLSTPGMDQTQTTGMQAITADQSSIKQASAIVIALGTNGGDTVQSINAAINAIRVINSSAPIYWVDTIVINRPDYTALIQAQNQAIYSQASVDHYSVISWFKTVDPNGNPIQMTGNETDTNNYIDQSDGLNVHPTIPAGVDALVNLVVNSVTSNSAYASGTQVNQTLACCNEGSAILTGNNAEQQAFNFFVQNGFTDTESAGIVGNLVAESSLIPTEIAGGGNSNAPSGTGWGIAQWTPSNKANTVYQQLGLTSPIDSLSTQLEMILGELNSSYSSVMAQIKAAPNVVMATLAFQGNMAGTAQSYSPSNVGQSYPGFEAPKDEYSSFVAVRLPTAEKILNDLSSGVSIASISCNPNPGSQGPATSSSTTLSGASSGYQYPFRDISQLNPERIDQGVDFSGTGPIYAIGDATINGIFPNWYKGEPYLAYTLNDGPAKGMEVYVAECITPEVQQGQTVDSNTVIAQMVNCGNGIETGWGNPSILGDSMAVSCWDKVSSSFGVNFSQFLQSLGGPGGISQEANPPCTIPSGWPSW